MKFHKPTVAWNTIISNQTVPLIIYGSEGVGKLKDFEGVLFGMNDFLFFIELPKNTKYGLVFSWLFEEKLTYNLHFYHGFQERWQEADPNIKDISWSIVNAHNQSGDNSCGTTSIISGQEELLRRSSPSLEKYLKYQRQIFNNKILVNSYLK